MHYLLNLFHLDLRLANRGGLCYDFNMLMIQHNQYFPFTEGPPSDAIAKTHMRMRNSIPCGFLFFADIIIILADQIFTTNAMVMVLESL